MAKNVKPGKLRGMTTPNELTVDKNDYVLNILGGMKYSLKDLAQLVVKSGTTTQREDQLVDGYRLMTEKGIEMGLQGNNINFEYFTMRFNTKGVFNSPNEAFTRPKHQVTASLSPGPELRKAMEETLVENLGPAHNFAQMDSIINTMNEDVNKTLTGGQVLEIYGMNLSLAGTDPAVGVYLQEEGAPDSQRIKAVTILNNEPKRLMFMVPTEVVNDKNYYIVHVSQAGKNKSGTLLKAPRTEITSISLHCVPSGTPGGGGGENPDENPDIL